MEIKNGLLTNGSNSIPLDKIVSCGVVEKNDVNDPGMSLIMKVISIFPMWGGFIFFVKSASRINATFGDFIIFGVVCAVANLVYLAAIMKIRQFIYAEKNYGLRLSLTSGEAELFWSFDKAFVFQVRDVIADALTAERKQAISYNINIEKQEIKNTSTTHVTNNYNYDIKIENNEGLSESDLKFLMNEFREGMQPVAQQVQESGNQELKTLMEELRTLVNSGNPPAGALKRVYDKMKACSEGFGVYQSVLGIGGLIGQAAMIFAG